MSRILRFAALGAVLVYFFRKARQGRLGRIAKSQAFDVKQKVKNLKEADKPDDATLAHKVETEIFRDAEVPKGQINVNAENGVVILRGQVEQPELIRDLEQKTRKVQGVQEVENLLHTPGTPVPTKS